MKTLLPVRRGWLSMFIIMASLSSWLGSAASGSEIITHTLESPSIAGNMVGISSQRGFQVYLPDGYEESTRRYPVLYWIPSWGAGLTGFTFRVALDNAIENGRIPPTIAVFIDVHEQLWCLNSPALGNWENFIALELIQFIDKEYRAIPDSRARALIGHSAGGYTAFMLPVRNPGIWSSVGGNDPALWAMWVYVRDKEDIIDIDLFNESRAGYKYLSEDIADYQSVTNWYTKDLIQLGTAFSPNPDTPLFCDLPLDADGEWVPEIRDKWSAHDLSNPDTLDKHGEVLKDLLSIVIVTPTGGSIWHAKRYFH